MADLIRINSGNIKSLLEKGANPKSIDLIETVIKTGGIIRSKTDLLKLGIPKLELDLIIPNITFAEPEPEKLIKTAAIETDLVNLNGYSLILKFLSIEEAKIIEKVFAIDLKGVSEIVYDDNKIPDNLILMVKSPNGEFLNLDSGAGKSVYVNVNKSKLNGTKLKVTRIENIITNTKVLAPTKLKGKILSNNSSREFDGIQVIIEVSIVSSPKEIDFFPICYAKAEQDGYFFTSQIEFQDADNLVKARARIGIADVAPIEITLNETEIIIPPTSVNSKPTARKIKILPERVILFVEEGGKPEENDGHSDCGCNDLDFHEKKTVEEFNFYSVIRTTEPLIEAFEIDDDDQINLEEIVDDPDLISVVSGIRAPRSVLNNFISRKGLIDLKNVTELVDAVKLIDLKKRVLPVLPKKKGRVELNGANGIDWDDKPTIYQATTIAHGHLLNFKQEWFGNGFSIGDLVYSLPLAPGQKKQIVVFDWDRKDSASNTQQIDHQESLYNSLSRDRDVNEIAKATLSEKLDGESESSTWGWGVGGGVGIAVPIPIGPAIMPLGALVGAAGGAGGGSSSASQNSSRSSTASSQQQINDRTIQAANSVRSQRSTVVQTVSQGERFEVSAEVIANYNHCHAMTVEYFEVLRHFEIRTRLTDVQECLFVPLRITSFDQKKALRWRDILSKCIKKRFLVSGFDALERISEELRSDDVNYYDQIGFPLKRYAEEAIEYLEGELFLEFQVTRPKNNETNTFDSQNWQHFGAILGGDPQEFYNKYIKDERNKDEAFAKNAGPKIAEAVIQSIEIIAVKNGASISNTKLPLDATLLSDFKNAKKLNVSLRMTGSMQNPIKREDIDFIKIRIKSNSSSAKYQNLLNMANGEYLNIIVHSGSMRYRTRSLHEYLFNDGYIKNDLRIDGDSVSVFTPLSSRSMRQPRLEDVELSNSLLHHLNENLEYYHQCIWHKMDSQRRFMLLDGLIAPGKAKGRSVASVTENKLIGIVGNCLVLPVAPGFQLDPTLDEKIDLYEHYYENPQDPVQISLPTKGVFAEAKMGACNSCEKKDESRFWRWEESPIPDSPTTILPVSLPTPQNVQPQNLEPKDFAAPIINLQNAPTLPDPQGFGALLTLLSNANLFNNITGLTENQKNAIEALKGSLATTQFFGEKATELTNTAASLVPTAAKIESLDHIKRAKENGLITEKQAQDLTSSAIQSILGNSGSTTSQVVDDLKKVKESVDKNEITPEVGKEVEDVIIDFENAKVESVKAKTKTEISKTSKTQDLELFVTVRNTDGRIVSGEELNGFDLNYIFEGKGGPIAGLLQFSGSRFGSNIDSFNITSGDFELQIVESGGVNFSGKDRFVLSRTATGLTIDATMDKKVINVTFTENQSFSETITNTISGEIGGKMSGGAKVAIAKIVELGITNELNAKLAAARASSTGSTSGQGVSFTTPINIPTGGLTLKIAEI